MTLDYSKKLRDYLQTQTWPPRPGICGGLARLPRGPAVLDQTFPLYTTGRSLRLGPQKSQGCKRQDTGPPSYFCTIPLSSPLGRMSFSHPNLILLRQNSSPTARTTAGSTTGVEGWGVGGSRGAASALTTAFHFQVHRSTR